MIDRSSAPVYVAAFGQVAVFRVTADELAVLACLEGWHVAREWR